MLKWNDSELHISTHGTCYYKITNSLFLPLDAIFFSCISSSFPQRLYRHNLKNEPDNCDTNWIKHFSVFIYIMYNIIRNVEGKTIIRSNQLIHSY